MKVFISWSGERSHKVAELLGTWIQCVIQAVKPWISSSDIPKGSLWFSEVSDKLSTMHNGIVCLTKSNLYSPWILFESGALAKGLSTSRVFTFLIDLEPKDVKDPLAQFNHTLPEKEDLYRLLRSINKGLGENSLEEKILLESFDTFWPKFNEKFQTIIRDTPEEENREERPKSDLLSEILYSVRGIDKRLRNLEDSSNINSISDNFLYMRKLLSTPIQDLDLSIRTMNTLRSVKIFTIGDLVKYDSHELLYLKNFNQKQLSELEELLLDRGLTFGMDLSKYGI